MPDVLVVYETDTVVLVDTPPADMVVVEQPAAREVVEIVSPGPQGPPGPPGQPGPPGSDKSFTFTQGPASATWSITHGLGKFPAVTVVDSAGDEVEGAVKYPSADQVVVSFSAPFSGTAHLN